MEQVDGYLIDDTQEKKANIPAEVGIIKKLGWQDHVQIDQIEEDLTITRIEFLPEKEITMRAEGPATFSIHLCLGGKGTVEIDGGAPFDVKPGCAILFSSDRYTKGSNHICAGEEVCFIDLRYHSSFLRAAGGRHLQQFATSLLNEHCVPEDGAFMIGFPMSPSLKRTAREILNCSMQGDCRELYLRAKSLEVLAHIIDFSDRAETNKESVSEQDRFKIEKAQNLLDQHFDKAWTIAALSREVGLNEKKMKIGFRQLIGKTINNYHQEVRLEAAASLLREGMSVTEVTFACGFSNLSHFAKIFRKKMGVNPSDFSKH